MVWKCYFYLFFLHFSFFVVNVTVFTYFYLISPSSCPPLLKPEHPDLPLASEGSTSPPFYSTASYQGNHTNTSKNHYLLAIVVLSSPTENGKKRRDTIRQTWMKSYVENQDVLIKFALGTEGLSFASEEIMTVEENAHGDLLLLPDVADSYGNLTIKVLSSFIALESLYNFSYLMKCDDDSFVLVEEVLRELAQRTTHESFYWGFFDGKSPILNKGANSEHSWFLCDKYLPYALGGGYVLSHDLVKQIVINSDTLMLYSNEDVSVGVWLSPYKIERRHDNRFNTEGTSRGCKNSYLVSHKQSVEDMFSKQETLESRGVQCVKEHQSMKSYVYNWSVLPSKCCQRRRNLI